MANSEWPKVLRTDDSRRRRKSLRGCTVVWMFTSSETKATPCGCVFLSSEQISTRSMSDLSHTSSWERLPQRIAARM